MAREKYPTKDPRNFVLPPEKPRPQDMANAAREVAWRLVKKHDEDELWDKLQARDVPVEIIDYVRDHLEAGFNFRQTMQSLGIRSPNDKRWRKIMSAIKQGVRVDTTGMFIRWMTQNEAIANRLQRVIEETLDHADKDQEGQPKSDSLQLKMLKLSQGIAASVKSLTDLRQATVKMGKELGVIQDPSLGGAGQGTQIIVQNNIGLPSTKDVKSHMVTQIQKTQLQIGKPKKDPNAPDQS